jgi:hypothetical protein
MQHDLHHRELVQVGVEQRLDDHRPIYRPRLPSSQAMIVPPRRTNLAADPGVAADALDVYAPFRFSTVPWLAT